MNFRNRLIQFMQGRYGAYGADALSKFMLIVAIAFTFSARILGVRLLSSLGSVILLLSLFRLFSRNIQARYRENERYLQYRNRFLQMFQRSKSTMQQRKTHHIYRCPSCGQKIRIPRGKGKVEIRCPKCSAAFIKNAF